MKIRKFFQTNFVLLKANKFYLDELVENPFKKDFTEKTIDLFISKNIFTYFKILKVKYIWGILKSFGKKYFIKFNSGKVIVFTGIDGVGKTTICNVLKRMSYGKYIYMGYGDTPSIFGNYYTKININNKGVRFIKFYIRYIENLIQLIRIFYFKLIGKIVILDRHPRLESVGKKNFLGRCIIQYPYKYFYYLPKYIFILYENSEVIYNRKKEKTIEEIDSYYATLKEFIKYEGIEAKWIKNEEINKTCKKLFNYLN